MSNYVGLPRAFDLPVSNRDDRHGHQFRAQVRDHEPSLSPGKTAISAAIHGLWPAISIEKKFSVPHIVLDHLGKTGHCLDRWTRMTTDVNLFRYDDRRSY